MILAGSVLFVLDMKGVRGHIEGVACASECLEALIWTFLHFFTLFTLQAPTAAPGATEEVRAGAVDTGR